VELLAYDAEVELLAYDALVELLAYDAVTFNKFVAAL